MAAAIHRWGGHAAALMIYGMLSLVLVDHGVPITGNLSGQGSDPYAFLWFLGWWPHAVAAHLPPITTNLIWYPVGVSLAWLTSIPVLACFMAPLTVMAGPAVSYNLLIIAAPIISAWFAYCLCLYLTKRFAAALIGGFLFGFSTYEMAQDTAALNLSMVFCLPALLLVILRRLDGSLPRNRAVAYAVVLLIIQFYICIELFAMIFLFGGVVWLFSYLYMDARRPVLRRLVIDAMIAAPFVIVAVLPFLIPMARTLGSIHHPDLWPYYFTADLLNVVIPSSNNLFGRVFWPLSQHFNGGPQEQDIYLGLPLLLLIWRFARAHGGQPVGRLLVACFLVFLLCSFGPRLWIGGHYSAVFMPWTLAVHLPLLGEALSTRFALFVSLAAAIIAALWIARADQGWARMALGLLCCVTLLPAPHPWRPAPYAAFFAPGRVQAVLGPNPRVLILPFSIAGPSSYWQMENDYGFTQVGGYLGFPPAPMQKYPAVFEMFGNVPQADFASAFVQFSQAMRTQFVIIGPGANPVMVKDITALGWPTRNIDDVTVVTVPGG